MNYYLLSAGLLCFILGILHSVLGEILIFKTKKTGKNIIPTIVTSYLKERHLRIIWASWHLVSFFGWCIGGLLIKIAIQPNELSNDLKHFIICLTSFSMFCAALLVGISTKGKHLGWIVLVTIGILSLL
jgi:hypothetical protein